MAADRPANSGLPSSDDDSWSSLAGELFGINLDADGDFDFPDSETPVAPPAAASAAASGAAAAAETTPAAAGLTAARDHGPTSLGATAEDADEDEDDVPGDDAEDEAAEGAQTVTPDEADDFWDVLEDWDWAEDGHTLKGAPKASPAPSESEPPPRRADQGRDRRGDDRRGRRGERSSSSSSESGRRSESRDSGSRESDRPRRARPAAAESESQAESSSSSPTPRPPRTSERRPREDAPRDRSQPERSAPRRRVKPAEDDFAEGLLADETDDRVIRRDVRPEVDESWPEVTAWDDEPLADEEAVLEATSGPPADEPDSLDEDAAPRRKRRRRRRRRPAGSAEVSDEARPLSDEGDSDPELESSVPDDEFVEEASEALSDDDDDERDEAPRRRRSRRRRRRPGDRPAEAIGRRPVRSTIDDSDDEPEGFVDGVLEDVSDEFEEEEPVTLVNYEDTPTWDEAISYLMRVPGNARGRNERRPSSGRRPPRSAPPSDDM
jgi:hypothetical protein